MKIALIGYGKMGKEIETIAVERGHTIVLKIDITNQHEFTTENIKKADVAIEFTNPEIAYDNVTKCFEADVPIVSGSTGWNAKVEEAKKKCIAGNHSFIWSSNYSLGVNIFFKVNDFLAKIMNKFNNYNVSMVETHHTQKLDAPSGTAITLANDIIKRVERKKEWQLNGEDTSRNLRIDAIRRDTVPGIHTINYDSPVDYIEITHSAKSRQGFAYGAVLAAEFIHNKKGVFTMDDLLSIS